MFYQDYIGKFNPKQQKLIRHALAVHATTIDMTQMPLESDDVARLPATETAKMAVQFEDHGMHLEPLSSVLVDAARTEQFVKDGRDSVLAETLLTTARAHIQDEQHFTVLLLVDNLIITRLKWFATYNSLKYNEKFLNDEDRQAYHQLINDSQTEYVTQRNSVYETFPESRNEIAESLRQGWRELPDSEKYKPSIYKDTGINDLPEPLFIEVSDAAAEGSIGRVINLDRTKRRPK